MKLHLIAAFAALIAIQLGCQSSQQRKQKDFFTSGSHEADQRADQRMAKDNQLKGNGSGDTKTKPEVKKTLFERLGGQDGVQKIVDDFVDRALADPRVNWERKGVTRGGFSIHRGQSEEWQATGINVKVLKMHLAQFVALATGGPSNYQGKEMKQSHENMHISNAEFDASVGDFKASLDKFEVAAQEQKELLSIIESTRPQIVEEQ